MHHNSRSIMKTGKLEEYELFFKSINNPFSILVFTETWLTNDKVDLCRLQGYSPIHLLRPIDQITDFKERGGGISIFVRNDITFKHRTDLNQTLPFMECCFIETMFNNKKYIIAGMYRIPNTNINLFTEKFNEIIEPLRSSHELIVLGDFNINLRNDDSHKRLFEICLQSNYLIPTIFAPTRIATKKLQNGQTITSETLIDNILIKANLSCTSGLIDTNISDHFPIYISIPEITLVNTNTPKVIQYRLVDENRKRKFRDALSRQQNYMNNSEAKQVFSGFGETFDDLYNKYFPIMSKTLTHKEEKNMDQ